MKRNTSEITQEFSNPKTDDKYIPKEEENWSSYEFEALSIVQANGKLTNLN